MAKFHVFVYFCYSIQCCRSLMQEALNRLKTNPAPLQPALCWAPFKQLHHELQARVGKRGQLSMKEISPRLAKLKDSYLPVPGHSGLTVSQFHPVLTILPTKTRPKKLHLRGGDGRNYTYLFKVRDFLSDRPFFS